jgi:hypothetical protein
MPFTQIGGGLSREALFLVLPCPPGLAVLRRLGPLNALGQGQLKLASAYQESGPGGGLGELFDDVVCNHSWPRGI